MTKQRAIAQILLLILGAALLAYTGSRTLHMLQATLSDDQQILAYFGLAAFDGGLILWTLYALHGARGAWQRGISWLMVILSLAGVVLAFVGDTLYSAGAAGLVKQMDEQMAIMVISGMSLCISLNIAALTACHMLDPHALQQAAENEAMDKLISAELEQMALNADQLAAELAPIRALHWRVRRERELLADLPAEARSAYEASKPTRRVASAPALETAPDFLALATATATATPATNGHHKTAKAKKA
jgi:hypothetical protein